MLTTKVRVNDSLDAIVPKMLSPSFIVTYSSFVDKMAFVSYVQSSSLLLKDMHLHLPLLEKQEIQCNICIYQQS